MPDVLFLALDLNLPFTELRLFAFLDYSYPFCLPFGILSGSLGFPAQFLTNPDWYIIYISPASGGLYDLLIQIQILWAVAMP